jgi:hypothetical protein
LGGDEKAIMLAWQRLLHEPDQVVELRAIRVSNTGYRRPHTEAGFYDFENLDKLVKDALFLTRQARGVYCSINPLKPELLARRSNRYDTAEDGELAKDKDVLHRRLFIDVDPIRDSYISSTDEEKAASLALAQRVRAGLRERSWPDPILGDSGNGHLLLYRIDAPADDGDLVKRVLAALAQRFDTEAAHIDRAVFNAGRIVKVPGTYARKGDNVQGRPWRRSRLLEIPGCPDRLRPETPCLEIVPLQLLEELAAEVKEETPAKRPPPRTGPSSTPTGSGEYHSRLKVEEWLTARGVPYRIKAGEASGGRTVYLITCPFDSSHTGGDTCIMQATDGRMSAHCFHASCAGRGWQDLKEAIGAPQGHHYDPPLPRRSSPRQGHRGPQRGGPVPAGSNGQCHSACPEPPRDPPQAPPRDPLGNSCPDPGSPGSPQRLPAIQGNQRQLRDVTADALKAVLAVNKPPTIFQRGGLLTRLRRGTDTEAPILEPLVDTALRGVLARVADWFKIRTTSEGDVAEEDAPPMEVVKDLASLPAWDGVPRLQAVVESPVFTCAGALVLAPGFHPAAQLWYQPAGGLVVPPVPPTPTAAEVEQARELLLVELLGDFPFEDDASRAHALAALLLPFVRQLIDGPTPLHLLDAPVEGTGKTLLASCISEVSTGRPIEAIAEAGDDEEWRKRITAVLIEGPTLVLLDNLNRVLDSGALAAVLTSRVWKDRILGVSKTVRVPNLAVWLASGNNTRLSRELVRRTVWCRLDSRTDAPWERTQFRHKNLQKWAKEQRGRLVWAALVLCQAWLAAGRPPGQQTLGMFEGWAETMGGILDVAGAPGLLANARKFRQEAADKGSEWRAFVAAWWARYGGEPVGVKELFQLVSQEQLLDAVLGDKGEASQRTRLGRALGKCRGRVIGDYRIRAEEEDHSHRQRYQLEPTAATVAGAAEQGSFDISG